MGGIVRSPNPGIWRVPDLDDGKASVEIYPGRLGTRYATSADLRSDQIARLAWAWPECPNGVWLLITVSRSSVTHWQSMGRTAARAKWLDAQAGAQDARALSAAKRMYIL